VAVKLKNKKVINKKKILAERKKKNVLRISANVKLNSVDDLAVYYTPGIAEVSKKIAKNKSLVWNYTMVRNSVAIVSDGSAVLGLGNIGPEAAQPVMEGKALLFSRFANIDAFPICLKTQNAEEIVKTVKNISPSFGGINLEDISAPRCFAVEKNLQNLGIPVMHDDQHGTAVVVLAGLINALKVVDKNWQGLRVVISGAGAAGTAIAKILLDYSQSKAKIIVLDSKGAISADRQDLNKYKQSLQKLTGNDSSGRLVDLIKGTDVFIGVSAGGILTKKMVSAMAPRAIVFAMANPVPEIGYQEAMAGGAAVIATGRSDYPNQVNNVLAFPGIFRGALDVRASKITPGMLRAASLAISRLIAHPLPQKIIPSPINKKVVQTVAKAVSAAAKKDKVTH